MPRRDFSATSGAELPGRLALVGLVVVPLLVSGLLAWALATPASDLDRVTAAIVNDDVPVTVDGQTVPLGRQFAAGLMAAQEPAQPVAGATPAPGQAAPATFTWVLTNGDDAAAGLAAGRYAAVVTVPATFSADATSYSGPAASARQATLRVQTTPASAWLDPAITAVVTQQAAAALNRGLITSYLGGVYDGFNTISDQIGDAADGAAQLSTGASQAADGTAQVASGAADLAAGLQDLASGAADLAAGLGRLSSSSAGLPTDTEALARGSAAVSTGVEDIARRIDRATAQLTVVVDLLCDTPGPLCTRAQTALDQLDSADEKVSALSVGARAVKDGNAALARAMPPLVAGIDDAAAGGQGVSSGADASQTGAETLSAGAAEAADGSAQVDDGAQQLASGLGDASQQIPTYSASDIATLSSVVAQPVLVDQDASGPGLQSAPLFAALALWAGGFASALAFQAVPSRRLMSGVSSGRIAGAALRPVVLLGAVQGLIVAPVVLGSVSAGPAEWLAFTASAIGIGVVFATVNLGLAALLGGLGRLIAVVFGLLTLAVGLSGTVPPVVSAIAGPLPSTHGLALLRATLTGDAATGWTMIGLLVLAGALAFGLVWGAVGSRRSVPLHRLTE
ncbi:MAG TPA: hypothetical protein VFN24_01930 [Microbacterium sp.]|nr:hypothetical protein [Microbacterium sp.]